MNGLGLDEGFEPVIVLAAPDVPVVRLAEFVLPDVEYVTDEEAGEAANPHLWLDVGYAKLYARRITDALVAADPDYAAAPREGATTTGAAGRAGCLGPRADRYDPAREPQARLVP